MSLSLNKTSETDIAIAHIISQDSLQTIYLSEEKYENPYDESVSCIDESIARLFVGRPISEIGKICSEIAHKTKNSHEIQISNNELMSIIPSDKPELVNITGQKGWGKSSLAARYAIEYHTKFPDRNIYLFTRMPDDIAYNGVECEEIIVNDVVDSGLVFEQLRNSLVIFDDIDNITNDKVRKWAHGLMDEAITCGRKEQIHIIYISHLIMNYKQTRVVLNESEKVIFFNGSGTYQNTDFLKRYAGLEKGQIRRLTSLKGWVCINRINPMYVVYKSGAFMV